MKKNKYTDIFKDDGDFKWITGVEDTFVGQSKMGKRKLDEYELTQHYIFWQQDIDLVKETGFDMLRYGIPWYKVNPAPGDFDWSWTDKVLDYMLEKDIEPIIDLMHYGTPFWLENQFLNEDYPKYVAEYAAEFAARYDNINYYTPLNEPFINAEYCGKRAFWPPYLEGDSGFVKLTNQIAKGIILTVNRIREVNPDSVMVHVDAMEKFFVDPDNYSKKAEEYVNWQNEIRFVNYDLISGQVNEDSNIFRFLAEHGFKDTDFDYFLNNRIDVDLMGLNYYPLVSVQKVGEKNGEIESKQVWGGTERYKELIKDYYSRYQLPIMLTETSVDNGIENKIKWLNDSVTMIKELRAEDVPVLAYTWWPIIDMVHWDYMEAFDDVENYLLRNGIWKLEMQFDRILKREHTPLVEHFKKVINEGV